MKEIALQKTKEWMQQRSHREPRIVKEEVFPVQEQDGTVTLRLVVETYEDIGSLSPLRIKHNAVWKTNPMIKRNYVMLRSIWFFSHQFDVVATGYSGGQKVPPF